MSVTSPPLVPSQVPPTAPREAWGVPDTPTDPDGQFSGNVSLLSKRPVPYRKRFTSEGTDGPPLSNIRQHTSPRMNQPQWQHQRDQYPHHYWQQQQQPYYRSIRHSASVPDGVGATTYTLPSYCQQHPPHGYPPYSGQPQWRGQHTESAGVPIQLVQGNQHGMFDLAFSIVIIAEELRGSPW